MTPLRAQLMTPPNARPDLGEVHGIDIRTGARRGTRPALLKLVHGVSETRAPQAAIPVEVFPAGFSAHNRIIKIVCRVFDLPLNELMSRRQNTWVAEARQVAIALVVKLTKKSAQETSLLFGRDHTTGLHAIRKMRPHIDAIEAHMPPDSILEWAIALKDRISDSELVKARRDRHFAGRLMTVTHCLNGHLTTNRTPSFARTTGLDAAAPAPIEGIVFAIKRRRRGSKHERPRYRLCIWPDDQSIRTAVA